MPFAVTMRLDDGAADRIRKMWLNLSRIGLALDCLVPRNEPHVTLAVLESYDDVEEMRSIVVSFAPGLSQVTLEFHAIGVYLGGIEMLAGSWEPLVCVARRLELVRYLPVSLLETVPLASTPPSTKDTL
jgi:hypothetical protein